MLKFSLNGASLLFGIHNFEALLVGHAIGFCVFKVFGLVAAEWKASAWLVAHQVTLKILCIIALLSLTQITYDAKLLAAKYSAT